MLYSSIANGNSRQQYTRVELKYIFIFLTEPPKEPVKIVSVDRESNGRSIKATFQVYHL